MSDLRESMEGFLGSSTIQVRDSSPSGQNDEGVEAILVPDGEVSFSQESLDGDGVTMQNVQLVGDNLVLMDGDMIVDEESSEILVQNEMYVDADQMDGQSEQMIAYIPESVPDQGQSLVIEESEVGIQRMEDSIQGEEGIYETNSTMRADIAPRVEDQRIEEVPTTAQHTEDSQAILVGFNVHQGEVEDAEGATYIEVESDRILLQEVPEQTAVEMQTMIMDQMEIDTVVPSHHERLQEIPLEESDAQQVQDEHSMQVYAVEDPDPEQETPATTQAQPRFQDLHPPVEPMLFNDGSAQTEQNQATDNNVGAQDQELQVVPDSSETVPSKTFLSENLHESMDGSVERISPSASSMGIQMVPCSSENSQDTMVLHREETLLQDVIYAQDENAPQGEERTGSLGELNEPVATEELSNVLEWQSEEEQQEEQPNEISKSQSKITFTQQQQQQLAGNDGKVEEIPCSSQYETSEENVTQANSDKVDQSAEGTSDEQLVGIPNEQIMLVESTSDEDTKSVTRMFQVAEAPQDIAVQEQSPSNDGAEQGYEMCIALPDEQSAVTTDFPQEVGGRTITVPISIGGQVQEIPIQIPDWADLTQQSLVAVTEDGTQIPLTFVQEEEDEIGEGQDGGEEEQQQRHIEVHLDSEMLSASQHCIPLDESELIAIQDGDSGMILTQDGESGMILTQDGESGMILTQDGESGMILTQDGESGMILAQDGENQYEVINMMDPHEYEIHDGIIRLVQKSNRRSNGGSGQMLRRLEVDSDISPATSVTPFYFDGSGMAINEQSILPDSPEELTNMIQIPEDAYLSGQPIELQMVEVSGGRVLQKAIGRGGTARGAPVPRGTQRKRRPYQRHSPRQPRRTQGDVTTVESQKAIRSIGQPTLAPLDEQQYVAIQEDRSSAAKDSSQIELSNETPSVISPENMQALIQVLQSLPNTARGQTIQIVLQSDHLARSMTPDQDSARTNTSETITANAAAPAPKLTPSLPRQASSTKEQQIKLIRMPAAQASSKTTSDIAIQVTPSFLESSEEMTAVPESDNNGAMAPVEDVALQNTTTITVLTEDIVPQTCINMLVEDDSFLFGSSKASKKPKLAAKRTVPKKIVTVEEVQYMIDPKPGVSYYAVVDYMSEHDQDGFSSASEMKRPEAQYSGFMEDHLELQSTCEQTKGRSVLESTLDSSVTTTPNQYQRRKYSRSGIPAVPQVQQNGVTIDLPLEIDETSVTLSERTYEQAMLEADLVSAQPIKQVRRRRRSRVRASRPVVERYEHRCGYCEFGSKDKILVVEHCISEHPEKPVKTLSLLPQMSGRMCPYCLQSFDHMEFFAHMRFAHNEVHPFKCGYCEFMGRDRNQVRHHIQKKHRLPMKVINLLDTNRRPEDADSRCSGGSTGKKRIMAYSEGEDTVYEYLTDEEEMEDNDSDNANAKRDLVCPECKRAFKTLKYLKTHIKIHQSLRYQCSYCDFISVMLHQVIRHCQKKHVGMAPKVLTKELDPDKYAVVSRDMETVIEKVFALNTRLPRDPDAAKWMRKWFCPHCDYACQFGASYRRHLRMHANILPYKCNYCSFKGREKYYVRRHIHRMHKDLPMIVVENNPENCARDTSSDEDYQEKGLRRRRRRRTKDAEHAVVPLGHLEDELLGPHFQKLPVGERGTRGNRLTIDELENEFPLDNIMRLGGEDGSAGGYRSRVVGMQRPSRAKLWSEENLDNYIKEQVGDMIVCKICGERAHEKVFHKHARKHFKLRPLKCGYCNYMSMEMSKIRAHNSLKHPSAPLKLEECHLASITPEDFMDLIGGDDPTAMTGDAQENDPLTAHFECPFCQATLAYTERCLQEHFYMHYDYYPFKCSECGFQATSEHKVAEHGASHDTEIIVYQIEMDKPSGLEETIQQFLREGEQIAAQRVNELLEQSAAPRLVAGAEEKDGLDGEASSGLTVSIFQCPVCDQQMTLHEVMVRRHLYEHYGYKPFKCGYCSFQGVSKGSIKQHATIHGLLKPRIGLSEEAMPEDLAKILRHIRSVMKLSPEKMESAVIPNEETIRLAADNEDPLTAEGRRWKELLAHGQCPWCDTKVAGARTKLHVHLLSHFSTRPFQCGHCDERFSRRRDVSQHASKCHPEDEPKIVEVIDDEIEMRKGLLQFMKSKRTSVGAHSLMKNTSVDEEKSVGATSQETLTAAIEDEMKKLIGEGKEFQYQVVILNEDGTVVETMEVMAQQPVAEDSPVADGKDPAARDIPTPPIDEDDKKESGMDEPPNVVEEVTREESARAKDDVPSAEAGAEKKSMGTDFQNVEMGSETVESGVVALQTGERGDEMETIIGSAVSSVKTVETTDKIVEAEKEVVCTDIEAHNEKDVAADGTPQDAVNNEVEEDEDVGAVKATDSDDEQKEQDEFNADIVTVDRVLLTRSFRSETEDSGEDDNPMGSTMSPAGSSNGSVNSDEDDDNDEMLAIGPSLEFVGDIISLLKHSSAALQAKKPQKVYKFMCQHCGVTFPRSVTLQKHIAREHECEDDAIFQCEDDAIFQCDSCEYSDADREKVKEHERLVHLNSSAAMLEMETPQTPVASPLMQEAASKGMKHGASEAATEKQKEKRAKTTLEGMQCTTTSVPVQEVASRGQKRGASGDEVVHLEEKRAKIVLGASSDPSATVKIVDSTPEVQEDDAKIPTREIDGQGEVVTDEVPLPRMQLDESEEETIENITKMVLEGEASMPAQLHRTVTAEPACKGSAPAKDVVGDDMNATIETSLSEKSTTTNDAAIQPPREEPEGSPLTHKSAPSRLEASKRENLKKKLEQEAAMSATMDLVPEGGATEKEDPMPSTPAAEASPSSQDPKSLPLLPPASAASKPSRLEAFKLEALKKAQSAAAKTSGTGLEKGVATKPPSKAARKPAEEAKASPLKPTRKSSRVTRLSKRARHLSESSAAGGSAVQVGKYKLRNKARKDEALPKSKKSKAGRAAAKSLMKAKTSAAKASVPAAKTSATVTKTSIVVAKTGASLSTPKTDTNKGESKMKEEKPKETEASTSQLPIQREETEVSAESNPEEGLEELENLEECDENLPKILQILQLRPTKDQEKT